MKQLKFAPFVAVGVTCAVMSAAVLAAAPVNAATSTSATQSTSEPTERAVLSEIREDLAASGTPADVAAFDQLSAEQRDDLASYFLDPAVTDEVEADATEAAIGSNTVRTSGDFSWGEEDRVETGVSAAGTRAASRSSWGTQWFSFAGIKLSETKVSMSYEYSGTTARKMLGYSCTVTRNIQPFTNVTTSKSSGYVSGGQATAKCKVVVKRGAPTPWGTVAWSTYSAMQRLSAKGNGAITANRWE